MSKVEYVPLSPIHTHKCMWCNNASLTRGNLTAKNQCCEDPKCMRQSREMCESDATQEVLGAVRDAIFRIAVVKPVPGPLGHRGRPGRLGPPIGETRQDSFP